MIAYLDSARLVQDVSRRGAMHGSILSRLEALRVHVIQIIDKSHH